MRAWLLLCALEPVPRDPLAHSPTRPRIRQTVRDVVASCLKDQYKSTRCEAVKLAGQYVQGNAKLMEQYFKPLVEMCVPQQQWL